MWKNKVHFQCRMIFLEGGSVSKIRSVSARFTNNPPMCKFIQTWGGDIYKCQYRYHINIFFAIILIYRCDIGISHPLKTPYFQFFMKYTVTHVRENYVRQKYMHFSIFGQDSLNEKVVNEKDNM